MPSEQKNENSDFNNLSTKEFIKKYAIAIVIACGLVFIGGLIVYKFFNP